MHRPRTLTLTCLVLALGLGSADAQIVAVHPIMTPVAELTGFLLKYLQHRPGSAEAYYRLGRAHYLAQALTLDKIGIKDVARLSPEPSELDSHAAILIDLFEPGRPTGAAWPGVAVMVNDTDPPFQHDPMGNVLGGGITAQVMTPAAAAAHRRDAILNLQHAVKLDPPNARYHLALACALEDYAVDADKPADPQDNLPATSAAALQNAQAEYLRAYDLAIKDDAKLKTCPTPGLRSIVSYEAGRNYLRLLNHPGVAPADSQKTSRSGEITSALRAFEQLPAAIIE